MTVFKMICKYLFIWEKMGSSLNKELTLNHNTLQEAKELLCTQKMVKVHLSSIYNQYDKRYHPNSTVAISPGSIMIPFPITPLIIDNKSINAIRAYLLLQEPLYNPQKLIIYDQNNLPLEYSIYPERICFSRDIPSFITSSNS